MTDLQKIKDQFLHIVQAIDGKETTFYDEDDDTTNTYNDGILEIGTDFLDYTTYELRLNGDELTIKKTRLDNYKNHDKAKVIEEPMDEDATADLLERIQKMAGQLKGQDGLKNIDLKSAWGNLMSAIFANPHLGKKPARTPVLQKDSYALATSLQATLKNAKIMCEWEWKEWSQIGVDTIRNLNSIQSLKLQIPFPSKEEIKKVAHADEYDLAILNWFDVHLSQLDLTLMAISPLDEMQSFALVGTTRIKDLQTNLNLLCIPFKMATKYNEK